MTEFEHKTWEQWNEACLKFWKSKRDFAYIFLQQVDANNKQMKEALKQSEEFIKEIEAEIERTKKPEEIVKHINNNIDLTNKVY